MVLCVFFLAFQNLSMPIECYSFKENQIRSVSISLPCFLFSVSFLNHSRLSQCASFTFQLLNGNTQYAYRSLWTCSLLLWSELKFRIFWLNYYEIAFIASICHRVSSFKEQKNWVSCHRRIYFEKPHHTQTVNSMKREIYMEIIAM